MSSTPIRPPYFRARKISFFALGFFLLLGVLPACSVSVEVATPQATVTLVPASPSAVTGVAASPTRAVSPTATIAPTPTETGQGTGTPGPTPLRPTVTPDPKARLMPLRQAPPDRIVIPSIQLDSKVVEVGVEYQDNKLVWQTPPFVVGHYLASANPGESGNAVFSGHISTPNSGSVFKRLPDVKTGDEVKLFNGDKEFDYVVTETQVVDPTNTTPMNPSKTEMVTLITCVPDGVYTQRLIVTARPKS